MEAKKNENQQTKLQTQSASKEITKSLRDEIISGVMERIKLFEKSGQLRIAPGYSPENALQAAWLILIDVKDKNGKPALEVCTKSSIYNSLLKMIVWSLSPLKKQCDFIVRGTILCCDIEYAGDVMLAKKYGNVKDVNACAIYAKDDNVEGDIFEFAVIDGVKHITKHIQTMDSLNSTKFKGGYCVLTMKDGTKKTEIMSMKQIEAAWNQSPMRGQSPAHKNFPDQMIIKTVIKRACKMEIRTSDDAALMLEDEKPETEDAEFEIIKKDEANKEKIEFLPEPEYDPSISIPEAGNQKEDRDAIAPSSQKQKSELKFD